MFWPIIKKPLLLSEGWIVTFGGGAVLCKSWFSKDILYDDTYLEIAPRADDLWYSKIADLNGVKVRVVPDALDELCFFQFREGLVDYNLPDLKSFIKKVKYRFLGFPLNYFGIVRYGNDKAYHAVEDYFERYGRD